MLLLIPAYIGGISCVLADPALDLLLESYHHKNLRAIFDTDVKQHCRPGSA